MKGYKENALFKLEKATVDLLRDNQPIQAKIKGEEILREENLMKAYDILLTLIDQVVSRTTYIEDSEECPQLIFEAVTTIIWCTRHAELDSLKQVKELFKLKFGDTFVADAEENKMLSVNEKIFQLIRPQVYPVPKINQKLMDLSIKYNVNYQIKNEHQPVYPSAETTMYPSFPKYQPSIQDFPKPNYQPDMTQQPTTTNFSAPPQEVDDGPSSWPAPPPNPQALLKKTDDEEDEMYVDDEPNVSYLDLKKRFDKLTLNEDEEAPKKKYVTTLYDYDARAPDELSFSAHVQLEVISEEKEEGWIECLDTQSNQKGLVPTNYVSNN